jgi:hypothetical protein
MPDPYEELVKKAHTLFNRTSIFDVMDVDRATAFLRLIDEYGPPDIKRIEQYLSILDRMRKIEDPPGRPKVG